MSRLVVNRDGGTSNEYGTFAALGRLFTGDVIEGFQVVPNGTPNMTVLVNPGSGRISTGTYPSSYGYFVSHDTVSGESVTITTAAASPRIDYIVGYVDKSATPSSSPANVNNTNNIFLFKSVAGTPSGSPVVPTVSQIQTAIGAANPYFILAQVAVGASVSTITAPNITDVRSMATTTAKVTSSNIDWTTISSDEAYVPTAEPTTSTSYDDLTTKTDTVTITVGTSGKVLVGIHSTMFGAQTYMSFAVSGANTIAASDNRCILINEVTSSLGTTFLITGLTAGSTTFKAKYKVLSGAGTFLERRIFAEAR